MSSREPKVGRLVSVDYHYPEEHTFRGKVESQLSKQFTIRGKDDALRFAFYTQEWRYQTEEKK
jgi:hypothetical protein